MTDAQRRLLQDMVDHGLVLHKVRRRWLIKDASLVSAPSEFRRPIQPRTACALREDGLIIEDGRKDVYCAAPHAAEVLAKAPR